MMTAPRQQLRKPIDVRRVLALALPHWKPLLVATLALFVGSGVGLLYPQAARVTIDDIVGESASYDLQTVGLVVLALFMLQAIFVGVRAYLFTVVGERIVTDLRKQLYAAVMAQEIGFFDANKTGELTSRLTSDAQVLQNTVTANVSMALRYGTQAIGGIIVLFFTSVKLAAVMIVAVPSVVAIAFYYGKKVRRLSKQVQDKLAESTAIAEESIAGVRTVRSFAAEFAERARYDAQVEESFEASKTRARVAAFFSGGVTFLGYATIAVILWIGGALVMEGEMTAGELTAFILYTLMVAFALGALGSLWSDFMKATGSAERVFFLTDRIPNIHVEHDPLDHPLVGRVRFENVSFAYPTRPEVDAMRDVTFDIGRGEKVALVGPSGAGKSTVANLLLRFYDPDDGQVTIDGIDVRRFDPDHLRRQIGVVAQEPVLFSGTVRENVRYGRPDASDDDVDQALRAANAWDFVNDFPDGASTVIGERGIRLSGGQKQRVAIARALLKDPALLILDEATSALDVESEALVQAALERLMEGRTTLIIAHRLSTVSGADKVIVLDRGRVAESGTHAELVGQQGLYHRLIETQRLGALA
jgi:ATP-binding cassette subfamily B protein